MRPVGGPSTAVNRTIDEPDNRAFLEALTSDADTVAYDLSHAAHVPPLHFLLISIRGSILLQILLGIAGLLSVVLMGMGGHRPRLPQSLTAKLPPWLAPQRESATQPTLSDDERAAILRERHPEWSEERIQRVVQSMRAEDE